MSADIELWLSGIETEVPQCPTPVIEMKVLETVIDLCERANVWVYDHPEIPIIEGVDRYVLDSPEQTLVHSLMCESRSATTTQGSRIVSVVERGEVELLSIPKYSSISGNGLFITVSLKPDRTAMTFADPIYSDHYEVVKLGSLSKLFMMQGRAWSNPQLSQLMAGKYEIELGKAKQAIDRNFKTGSQRIKIRRYV